MPKPGTKPTPAAIRLINGRRNSTRHGSEAELKAQADLALDQYGRMKKPRYLKGEAAKAWKMFVEPAVWLDAARFGACVRMCQLWQESQLSPFSFQASKEAQLRGYFADLGLTDERNRGKPKAQDADPYFED